MVGVTRVHFWLFEHFLDGNQRDEVIRTIFIFGAEKYCYHYRIKFFGADRLQS